MTRAAACLLLLALPAAALSADEYFEVGVDYLRKGLYRRARAAFTESLVRAPGQPVPLAFTGLASAAEGRPAAEAAQLLRWAYARVPEGKALRLDLARLLPSPRALALLQADYRRAVARAGDGEARRHALTVLAFLEVHDGDPREARALDRLLADAPGDPYAIALDALRPAEEDAPAP